MQWLLRSSTTSHLFIRSARVTCFNVCSSDNKKPTIGRLFVEQIAHLATSCFQVFPDVMEAMTYLGARLPEAVHASGQDECL